MGDQLQPLVIACCVVLGIQLIYIIVLLLAFQKKRKSPGTEAFPDGIVNAGVSVIVCAHDDEENVRELVPLLLAQDHGNFEVVVVDDRSNDGTYDYLAETSKQESRVRMVHVTRVPAHINAKKYALTLGIKSAKHDWVLLTDADCRPASTSWIRHMAALFTPESSIVIGFSPYQKRKGLLNAFIRFETILTAIQYVGMAILGKPYMGVGRNLAYRKAFFIERKGFNDHLGVTGGDDDLFVNKNVTQQNAEVALGPDTIVHSVPKQTWRAYFVQKVRHLSVGKRYRLSDRLTLGLFTFTWILSWVCLPVAFLPGVVSLLVLGLFFTRWFLLVWLFSVAPRKLGETIETWKVPILDFIYAFYYLVAGPVALLSKKVRWKV